MFVPKLTSVSYTGERTVIYAGFAIAFLILFATLPAAAVLAGLGYLVGRSVTHIVLYAAG